MKGEMERKTVHGNKADLEKAISALHASGVRVYADIVFNHMANENRPDRSRGHNGNDSLPQRCQRHVAVFTLQGHPTIWTWAWIKAPIIVKFGIITFFGVCFGVWRGLIYVSSLSSVPDEFGLTPSNVQRSHQVNLSYSGYSVLDAFGM